MYARSLGIVLLSIHDDMKSLHFPWIIKPDELPPRGEFFAFFRRHPMLYCPLELIYRNCDVLNVVEFREQETRDVFLFQNRRFDRHDFSTQNISEGWKSRKEVELFSVPSARYGRRAIAINATSSKSRWTDLPTAIVSLAECTRLTFLRTNRRRSWLRFRRRPTPDEKLNSDRTASVENGVKFQFEYQHASHKWRFMLHEFKINQHEQSFCETN